MIISKLIKKLEEAKSKYGDVEVARFNEDWEQGDFHVIINKIVYKNNLDILDGDSSTKTYIYLK